MQKRDEQEEREYRRGYHDGYVQAIMAMAKLMSEMPGRKNQVREAAYQTCYTHWETALRRWEKGSCAVKELPPQVVPLTFPRGREYTGEGIPVCEGTWGPHTLANETRICYTCPYCGNEHSYIGGPNMFSWDGIKPATCSPEEKVYIRLPAGWDE